MAAKVGSKEHMLARYRAWVSAGNPPDRFLENYNRNRDASFTEADLQGAVGTTQHLLSRYSAWLSAGHDADKFLENYNRNRNTSYSQSDLNTVVENDNPGARDAYMSLLGILEDYGLGSLANWLWSQILDDVPEAEIFINLRKTDQYKQRFPGMDIRRQNGLRALSEHEYIQAEEGYRNVLRNVAGVRPERYDQPSDFLDYFARDISVDEAGERAEIWRLMTKAPQMNARIKGLFKSYTGTSNVSDEQLFEMMVEQDHPLLQQLHTGITENTAIKTLSLVNLKETINRAMAQEAATFRGGGGQIVETQGLKVGVTGAATERFT